MGLLDGKKILVTGVLMDSSIAFHVARIAQQEGAEVVLTSFGRTMKITQAIARRLPRTPPVIELDASNAQDFEALSERVREHVDGSAADAHRRGGRGPDVRRNSRVAEVRLDGRREGGLRVHGALSRA
jgi:enoyl ACP reductase